MTAILSGAQLTFVKQRINGERTASETKKKEEN